MIGLLQRVSEARVTVGDEQIGAIGPGLLVFVGVQPHDGPATAQRLIERCLGYRVFPDATGRMNLSLTDIAGGLLLVPHPQHHRHWWGAIFSPAWTVKVSLYLAVLESA